CACRFRNDTLGQPGSAEPDRYTREIRDTRNYPDDTTRAVSTVQSLDRSVTGVQDRLGGVPLRGERRWHLQDHNHAGRDNLAPLAPGIRVATGQRERLSEEKVLHWPRRRHRDGRSPITLRGRDDLRRMRSAERDDSRHEDESLAHVSCSLETM